MNIIKSSSVHLLGGLIFCSIRLYRYYCLRRGLSILRIHLNDVLFMCYIKEKKKETKWVNIDTQEEREKWKIMPPEINKMGIIAYYPGSIDNYSWFANLENSVDEVPPIDCVNFPVLRCRCQLCGNEHNNFYYYRFLYKRAEDLYSLDYLLQYPIFRNGNKGKTLLFPRFCQYCFACKKRETKENLLVSSLLQEEEVVDPNDLDVCYICQEKEAVVKCLPCEHKCTCKTCARKMIRLRDSKSNKSKTVASRCPMCRQTFTHFEKIDPSS